MKIYYISSVFDLETSDWESVEQQLKHKKDLLLEASNTYKFCVFNVKNEEVLLIFTYFDAHASVVLAYLELKALSKDCFFGAGRIKDGSATFGSRSCFGKYGYDRPDDEGALLGRIKQALEADQFHL